MNQAASQAGTRKLILGGWIAGDGSQSIEPLPAHWTAAQR
jgi:hypothetical protein